MMSSNSKILFLGSAGDSIVMGKQMRSSGGIYIETEDMHFLINPGPGAVVHARQHSINLREIDAVLVSENSLLLANDTNAIIDAMSIGGLDTKGVVICAPNVLNGTPKSHPAISPFHRDCVEKIIALKEGDKVAINSVEIHPTNVKSQFEDSLGFVIAAPTFTIGICGNTGYQKGIAEQYKKCDILILHVPHVQKKSQTSLDVEDAIKFVEVVKPRLVIMTYFGIKMLESDILTHVRDIQKATGVETIAAKEGLVLDPKSYSHSERQKKLV